MIHPLTAAILFALTTNLLLGTIVLATNARRLANRVFTILSVLLAFWLIGPLFGSLAKTEPEVVFWIRFSYAVGVFIPLVYHSLCCAVREPTASLQQVLFHPRFWVLTACGMVLLSLSPALIAGGRLATSSSQMPEPVYGPGVLLFVAYWVFSLAMLARTFVQATRTAEGACKLELQFMALGSGLALVPGVILILLVPLVSRYTQTPQFIPVAVVLWYITIAYGIATRHIMGVEDFLRRVISYLLLAGTLILLYLAAFYGVLHLPFDGLSTHPVVAHVCAAVAIAICLSPANAFFQSRTDRLFSRTADDMTHLLRRGSDLTHAITTIDALLDSFGGLLQRSLNLTSLQIYIRNGDHFDLRYRHNAPAGAGRIALDAPLAASLRATRHPLIRDVLQRFGRTPSLIQTRQRLAESGAEAAIALHSKGDLEGFVLLGRRQGGRAFASREESALALLGDQMGIAIENALLYTRLQDAKIHNDVLLDNLLTGVVATDTQGRITVCNREAHRILCTDESIQMIGRPTAQVLPQELDAALQASLSARHEVRDVDTVLHSQTERSLPVRYGTAVFCGHANEILGTLLVIQDTSTLRKLEEQVRRSDRLASLGTLAAGMAHEIKNPLVCLKTFGQLLPERYDDPDFRNTFAPLLGVEVQRIDTIVSQLLNFARPTKPSLSAMSIHTTLQTSLNLVTQQLKSKQVKLVQQLDAPRDRVLGDDRLLSQVFVNLLLNGIDAMADGGTLTVRTRLTACPPGSRNLVQPGTHGIELAVCDTGHGISAADLPHVFDPFFTTKTQGTGLGLSVAHGIVREHQGLIDAESTPGIGTCFRVWLPLLSGDES